MLDFAKSNLHYPALIFFLGLHGIGTILGLAYNSRTPDLYVNNAHSKLAWAMSGIILLTIIARLLKSFKQRKQKVLKSKLERKRFASSLEVVVEEDQQNLERNLLESESSTSSRASIDGMDSDTLCNVSLPPSRLRSRERYYEPMSWGRRWSNVSGSHRFVRALELFWYIFSTLFVVFGFVVICTGIVTMAGIFVSTES